MCMRIAWPVGDVLGLDGRYFGGFAMMDGSNVYLCFVHITSVALLFF